MAVCCLTHPLPADAVEYISYTPQADGRIWMLVQQYAYGGFLAVTEPSVTVEILAETKGVSSVVPFPQGDDSMFTVSWSPQVQACVDRCGEDTALYLVLLKPAYTEIMQEYCLDFTLWADGVYDTIPLDCSTSAWAKWNGTFQVTLSDGADTPSGEFGIVTLFDRGEALYAQCLAADPPMTDYEILLEAEALAAEFNAANEGRMTAAPDFDLEDWHRYYSGRSAWDGIGDCTGDGFVNAVDASAALEHAAAAGADGKGTLSAQQQDCGDVNRDGVLDAADASAILVYAAAAGSGEPTVWGRILS